MTSYELHDTDNGGTITCPGVKAPRIILGTQFIEALIQLGVIRVEDLVTRVVVDAQVNHVLVVYVDRVGDDRLLDVTRTLESVEIRTKPAAEQPT